MKGLEVSMSTNPTPTIVLSNAQNLGGLALVRSLEREDVTLFSKKRKATIALPQEVRPLTYADAKSLIGVAGRQKIFLPTSFEGVLQLLDEAEILKTSFLFPKDKLQFLKNLAEEESREELFLRAGFSPRPHVRLEDEALFEEARHLGYPHLLRLSHLRENLATFSAPYLPIDTARELASSLEKLPEEKRRGRLSAVPKDTNLYYASVFSSSSAREMAIFGVLSLSTRPEEGPSRITSRLQHKALEEKLHNLCDLVGDVGSFFLLIDEDRRTKELSLHLAMPFYGPLTGVEMRYGLHFPLLEIASLTGVDRFRAYQRQGEDVFHPTLSKKTALPRRVRRRRSPLVLDLLGPNTLGNFLGELSDILVAQLFS